VINRRFNDPASCHARHSLKHTLERKATNSLACYLEWRT
jgi:hypothetical protein